VIGPEVTLFDFYESPDLIELKLANRDAANFLGQKLLAAIPGQLQDVQNRPLLDIAKAGSSTHAVAFHEAVEDLADLLLRKPHIRAKGLLLGILEALAALLAFPTLYSGSVLTGLNGFDFAIVTGHCESP
jgi:hypothetical protein